MNIQQPWLLYVSALPVVTASQLLDILGWNEMCCCLYMHIAYNSKRGVVTVLVY
jgi:hypothetical protein